MTEASGAVTIPAGDSVLHGDLVVPEAATGLVVFAHGSGSSRHSSRNRQVAVALNDCGLATLLMDLLTADEEVVDRRTNALRFDIPLLGDRVVAAVDWAREQMPGRRLGLFGASTGAAAALVAAANRPGDVGAVVSRGGRPDLAADSLTAVAAPTLLIVGERDEAVIELNAQAQARLTAPTQTAIVPGATHLFEEPGALEQVSALAGRWFTRHLPR